MSDAETFETEVCSRCAGSGKYSYCTMYGTTCFKCAGRKVTYTNRGDAAYNYYNRLLTRRADSIKVGDWISDAGRKPEQVKEIIPASEGGSYSTSLDGVRTYYMRIITKGRDRGVLPDSMVRCAFTREQLNVYKKLAMRHQSFLLKTGKLAKRLPIAA